MTNLLTEIMRKVVELPEDRQDDAAQVLMLMLEHDPAQYRLGDEQLQEVGQAIADVDAGNFATNKESDQVLHCSWVEGAMVATEEGAAPRPHPWVHQRAQR